MQSGRHLAVLTEQFENYLVLRYRRVLIITCGDDLSLKEGGGLERDFCLGVGYHALPFWLNGSVLEGRWAVEKGVLRC